MARGIFKIKDGWANQHSACVEYDDGQTHELPEDRYRAQGYNPPFDKLPWQHEIEGRPKAKKS